MGAVLAVSFVPAGAAGAYSQPSALNDGNDYSTVCPPRPADYAGTDSTVGALVTVQQELADGCVRQEQLSSRGHADAQAVKGATDAVHSVVAGWTGSSPLPVGVTGPAGVQVTSLPANASSTVTLSDASAGQLAQAAVVNHGDLWAILGAIVGTFVAAEILRRVFP